MRTDRKDAVFEGLADRPRSGLLDIAANPYADDIEDDDAREDYARLRWPAGGGWWRRDWLRIGWGPRFRARSHLCEIRAWRSLGGLKVPTVYSPRRARRAAGHC